MRFTALLLLAALVEALVCAHDTTTDYIQAATTKDSLSSKLEITAPAESTSLQEATAAQKTSGAAEAPARITLRRQGLNPLKSIIEKSFLLADQAFDGAEKRADEGIQDGKQLFEGGADFIQRLRKILLDPRKFWFLSI
ncbi:extracellular glycoprotein lacritin [Phyllostomus hastatus]|uniref:extracellular glycoprotein lacritin n=1 Tax=Phyllostomus hastatus TaxID=9423 RepID=UPI001E685042|nr:extracellular glycoprotein lacritin [Phyllostomus hastatus]